MSTHTLDMRNVSTFEASLGAQTWSRGNINWCLIFVTASMGMMLIVHIIELIKNKSLISGEAEALRYTREHEYKMSHNPTLEGRNAPVPGQPTGDQAIEPPIKLLSNKQLGPQRDMFDVNKYFLWMTFHSVSLGASFHLNSTYDIVILFAGLHAIFFIISLILEVSNILQTHF